MVDCDPRAAFISLTETESANYRRGLFSSLVGQTDSLPPPHLTQQSPLPGPFELDTRPGSEPASILLLEVVQLP